MEATKFWTRAHRTGGPLFPPDMWAPLLFFLFPLSSGSLARRGARGSRAGRRRHHPACSSPGALAAGLAVAALLCCGAAASLLPLAASTALWCAAAGLFAAEEQRGAVEAVVLVGGRRRRGKPEAELVQVIGEANASAYAATGGGV